MSDIVERLRWAGKRLACGGSAWADCEDAANEIECLRAENAKLRESLAWIVKQEPATQDYTLISDVCERARAALKGTQP